MTEPRRCIYCRSEMSTDDPCGDLVPSKEHIIPWALGGSNGCVTWDASRKQNNELGTLIDAPFLSFLPIAIKRHELRLESQGGVIPPIILKAKSLNNNEPIDVTIDVDGNISYAHQTTVITDVKDRHSEQLVAGSRERVFEILRGMLASAASKNRALYSVSGLQMQTVEDFEPDFVVEETNELKASIALDTSVWIRGICKIVLGLGHVAMGPEWSFGVDGDRFRSILYCDRRDWPHSCLRGFSAGRLPDSVSNVLGITEDVRRKCMHTISVIPGEKECHAALSLFGGEVPEALISLGTERGRLATVNDTMRRGDVVGFRIDPASRQAEKLTVSDLMTALD